MATLKNKLHVSLFSLAATVFGVSAYFFYSSYVSQGSVFQMFGVSHADSSLALTSCTIDIKQQSEEVYFLSCGGIY